MVFDNYTNVNVGIFFLYFISLNLFSEAHHVFKTCVIDTFYYHSKHANNEPINNRMCQQNFTISRCFTKYSGLIIIFTAI